jgi:hypothetical protein
MFTLIDPRVWAALAIAAMAAFAAGYLTKAHYAAVALAEEKAKVKTVVETVEKVVTVTDGRRVQVLAAKLKASEAKLSALQKMIAEEANEKPAPVECRISDGLRQSINDELSAAAQ